ncbi:hypothetical protein DYB26_005589 [Aphanomyces astaci]|uniref:Uncharacterized protein n=1 Tax=Aphanomyces astaci TaxID=112090 RepID=A0A397FVR0_APHAT|nr:hypothetical protein DYB26_005589 [Aphanomyces astaci]RHZ38147.1 hypothetical protein DYB31_007249 [Aphanomyces astaci]
MKDQPHRWQKVQHFLMREAADVAFAKASESMERLNINAAKLMHKVHEKKRKKNNPLLSNLAASQKAAVDLELHTLPIIKDMLEINAAFNNNWRLPQGYSSETSGGLLVTLPHQNAQAYMRELEALDGQPSWLVGRVVQGSNQARILPDVRFVPV